MASSNEARLAKQEARKRGAASRVVNVENLDIKPINYRRSISKTRSSIEGSKPKQLNSALVDDHDLDTRPRLRRPSSIIPKSPPPPLEAAPARRRRSSTKISKPKVASVSNARAPSTTKKAEPSNSKKDIKRQHSRGTRIKQEPIEEEEHEQKATDRNDTSMSPANSNRRRSARLQGKSRINFSDDSIHDFDQNSDDSDTDANFQLNDDDINTTPSKSSSAAIITPRKSKRILDSLSGGSNKLSKLFQTKVSRPLKVTKTTKKKAAESASSKKTQAKEKLPRASTSSKKSQSEGTRTIEKSSDKPLESSGTNKKRRRSARAKSEQREEDEETSLLLSQASAPQPIPLTKTKLSERQKPLYVDVERLDVSKIRSKFKSTSMNVKPNTIDILSHLIKSFEPPSSTYKSTLNENVVHESFKSHILYHLNTLIDTNSSIGNLSSEISKIQKKKEEMRSKMYNIRSKHSEVGHEMNEVRSAYQRTKEQFESINDLEQRIRDLKSSALPNEEASEGQVEEGNIIGNKSHAVSLDLESIDKIVNPVHGMYQKLSIINEKLSELNN